MKTYYHSACAYYLENWKSNLFLQRFSKQIEIYGFKMSFSLWDYLKSLPEYLPDPRIIIPVTRRESSGITRPAPIPEKQLPDLPDTRKNVTRASTNRYHIFTIFLEKFLKNHFSRRFLPKLLQNLQSCRSLISACYVEIRPKTCSVLALLFKT